MIYVNTEIEFSGKAITFKEVSPEGIFKKN